MTLRGENATFGLRLDVGVLNGDRADEFRSADLVEEAEVAWADVDDGVSIAADDGAASGWHRHWILQPQYVAPGKPTRMHLSHPRTC